jgi:hypothetical protein
MTAQKSFDMPGFRAVPQLPQNCLTSPADSISFCWGASAAAAAPPQPTVAAGVSRLHKSGSSRDQSGLTSAATVPHDRAKVFRHARFSCGSAIAAELPYSTRRLAEQVEEFMRGYITTANHWMNLLRGTRPRVLARPFRASSLRNVPANPTDSRIDPAPACSHNCAH